MTDTRQGDEDYLEQVLSFELEADWSPERISEFRDLVAPWVHNIRLPHGIYTTYSDEYYPEHKEIMTLVSRELGGRFEGRRVLDVGCLEGYFSVECALQGADVLGVDVRALNVKKCDFIKSVLGLTNASFAQADALELTRSEYGSFDVVFVLGLLYHLDDPFTFLSKMAELCDGFMVLETLMALEDDTQEADDWRPRNSGDDWWKPQLSELRRFEFDGNSYEGRLYREFEPDASQLHRELSPRDSMRNDLSLWPTETSLVSALRDVGFQQVAKVGFSTDEQNWWSDPQDGRGLFLAVKDRPRFRSKVFAER